MSDAVSVRSALFGLLAAALAACALGAPAKPSKPIPAVEHVVLVSIDGLRPDLALRANMPTLRRMLNGEVTNNEMRVIQARYLVALTITNSTAATAVRPDRVCVYVCMYGT